MLASSVTSLLDALASVYEDWKYGASKDITIIRSSSAIVSVAASALLIWIMFRSRDGMKTTYHRLLLGLSVSNILYSFSMASFSAVVPSELNYVIWNARGSLASCDAFGFMINLGLVSGPLYMCSLSLYYLAKVRFNKTESFIAKKLEPWLHLVSTLYPMITSVVVLVKEGMNATIYGVCSAMLPYDPPHCNGYKDGDTPDGFDIPCGRGTTVQIIAEATAYAATFLASIIMCGSLLMIYRSVSRTERRIVENGAEALLTNHAQPTSGDAATLDIEEADGGGREAFTTLSAYIVAFFVTWSLSFVYFMLDLADAVTNDLPQPKWEIAFMSAMYFFNPFQGLWIFFIYMRSSVIKRKRSSVGHISWFRAFADAL